MKPVKLMNQASYWGFDVEEVERKYNAKFLGAWCILTAEGNWSQAPVDIFYVEHPDTLQNHTHYFGLFHSHGKSLIAKGDTAFEGTITGIDNEDGTVTVSRYRHDFVHGKGGTIDGGRDYVKVTGEPKLVNIIQKDGEFFMEEHNDQ